MLHVSDHALVRFLERAGGLDVEAIRKHISMSLQKAAKSAEQLGQANYSVMADGVSYIVKAGTVTTVLYDDPALDRRRGR